MSRDTRSLIFGLFIRLALGVAIVFLVITCVSCRFQPMPPAVVFAEPAAPFSPVKVAVGKPFCDIICPQSWFSFQIDEGDALNIHGVFGTCLFMRGLGSITEMSPGWLVYACEKGDPPIQVLGK